MALEVIDLTEANYSNNPSSSEYISGKEVKGNIAYTQITVVSTRNNGGYTSLDIDTRRETITSGGSSVPIESSSGSSKLSATTRLTSSIALPLPKSLPYSFSHDWSQEETGFLERIVSNVASRGMSVEEAMREGGNLATNTVIKASNLLGFRRFNQKNLGISGNPFKEMFYAGSGFRTFSFSWEFAPKSKKEADALDKLIGQLEIASHPEFTNEEGSAWNIPDTFEIEFRGTNLPKITPLALTSMNIDYGQYGPKFMSDGSAAFVTMDLSFTEMIPLTKKNIRESRNGRVGDAVSWSTPDEVSE